jgi:hypothetical protein
MATSGSHILKKFIGKLIFGNGNTVAAIDSTGTVTSSVIGTGQGALYSALNPALPSSNYVHDIDVSQDGNYLLVTASDILNENIATLNNDTVAAQASDGYLYRWNGTDSAITSSTQIPSYAVTALQTYLSTNLFFANDAFGAALNDGTNKILSLPDNKPPFPNATTANGNFLTWINPEIVSGTTRVASLYYFGSLDAENPPGLYRVLRYSSPLTNGFVYQTPVNIFTNTKYQTLNNSSSSIVSVGWGKHYLSVFEDSSGSSETYRLLRFFITPTGTGTPQSGVYETQTQLFGKRISIKQIRVYTEPTSSGQGFQLDCIGSDGAVITNGSFTYTFSSGSDPTTLTGSLERINFNPAAMDVYALGIRITNTGTSNMTVKKVEIDYGPSGK